MRGYAETGEDFGQSPTHTDNGIEIVAHALNGESVEIVELAGIPHDKIQQTPETYIDGVRYIYDRIDDGTGNCIFRRFETAGEVVERETAAAVAFPAVESEFPDVDEDPDHKTAVDVEAATD